MRILNHDDPKIKQSLEEFRKKCRELGMDGTAKRPNTTPIHYRKISLPKCNSEW